MNTATLINQPAFVEAAVKNNNREEYPFSLEEMRLAAQSTANFYARLEKGEAKPFKSRE